jgi:uncharacterized protein YdhG (YjbR/CyaY superfamily)
MTTTKKSGTDTTSGGFSAEERAAMKERAEEIKAETGKGSRSKKDGEADVLAKIATMPDADRKIALRIHEIVKDNAPELKPKTWYGMPAYALNGKVVIYFQDANKFKARYATLGFDETAHLDEGDMWPTSFALTKLTPTVEKQITDLVKKAVG